MSRAALHPALLDADAVVFDLDGVVYAGDVAIPGAARTVRRVREAGIPVRFLTNTTSKGRRLIAEKLVALGVDVAIEEVICPSFVAGRQLRERGESAYPLVRDGAVEDFEGIEIVRSGGAPDAVVVGDLAEAWSYKRLNRAFRFIKEGGARLIGLGRSRYWRSEDGLILDAGPFIAALEFATGQKADILGKPEAVVFESIAADLGVAPARIAMVGDDVQTDIVGASAVGWRTILVKTGKFRPDDLDGTVEPAFALDSIADLAVD